MKKTENDASPSGESPSELIDARIEELGDWRGETLARIRSLIKQAEPEVTEEWKWRGVPVWYHDGMICTGETYKNVVKVTFAKGAQLDGSVEALQLQPRRQRQARHRPARGRHARRVRVQGAHPRGSGAELERAVDLPLRVPLLELTALVAHVLTPCQRQLDLRPAVLEIEANRDERQPLLLHLAGQRGDLLAVQEELPGRDRGRGCRRSPPRTGRCGRRPARPRRRGRRRRHASARPSHPEAT